MFETTARFNISADYDACAHSVLTPYPGTLTWYEMKKADRIVSHDWTKYDQANSAPSSIVRRFPLLRGRGRLQWTIYNLFMKGRGDRS